MNRRFVRSLLLAALLVLLCTQVFAAQETLAALRLDPEPGFTTRMEGTDGNTLTRSGVLESRDGLANSVRSAKIASYSIYYNGRLLMTVTPVGFSEPDAAVMSGGAPTCTGFYKTTFSIDDTRGNFPDRPDRIDAGAGADRADGQCAGGPLFQPHQRGLH